jgi:hypothetical protein
MTFHRTAGKGGTRNSRRTKHPELSFPNFNKSTRKGAKQPARTGRVQLNPAKKRRTVTDYIEDAVGAAMIGKSEVTGRLDSTFKDSRYK